MKIVLLALSFVCILCFSTPAAYGCWKTFQDTNECLCFEGTYYPYLSCIPGPTCTVGGSCGVAGCFLAGALVETRDGLIPIEDIRRGDEVLSVSKEDGELEYQIVADTHRVIQFEYFLINGSMRVTASHPFRVNGEWVDSDELEVGDELTSRDGETLIVSTIERLSRGVRAYNISVTGSHTFFVNGLLVHNKPPNPGG